MKRKVVLSRALCQIILKNQMEVITQYGIYSKYSSVIEKLSHHLILNSLLNGNRKQQVTDNAS